MVWVQAAEERFHLGRPGCPDLCGSGVEVGAAAFGHEVANSPTRLARAVISGHAANSSPRWARIWAAIW